VIKVSLFTQPETGVSHNPEIRKRVLLALGEVPHLTNFSQAVFEPGQICTPHAHESMVEVYYIMEGAGTITIDAIVHTLAKGACVAVDVGETHSVANTGVENLVVMYFGIAV
jgi:mannose-6-phosphate isomerase-like protein (cupin superfamily)